MNVLKKHQIGIGAALALLCSGYTQASLVSCTQFGADMAVEQGTDPVDITNRVTANVGCTVSTTANQDFLGNNPANYTANLESFFDFSDWQFAGKEEFEDGFEDGVVDIGYNIVGNTWNLGDGAWDLYTDIMLIFKSGQNELVGYLLQPGDLTGNWSTPFTSGPFDLPGQSQAQAVSHITAYVRGEAVTVAEPGALALLGLGLAALTASRRRNAGSAR